MISPQPMQAMARQIYPAYRAHSIALQEWVTEKDAVEESRHGSWPLYRLSTAVSISHRLKIATQRVLVGLMDIIMLTTSKCRCCDAHDLRDAQRGWKL